MSKQKEPKMNKEILLKVVDEINGPKITTIEEFNWEKERAKD